MISARLSLGNWVTRAFPVPGIILSPAGDHGRISHLQISPNNLWPELAGVGSSRAQLRAQSPVSGSSPENGVAPETRVGGGFEVARPAGFEPATYGLEVRCSIQLSYGRASDVAELTGFGHHVGYFLVLPPRVKFLTAAPWKSWGTRARRRLTGSQRRRLREPRQTLIPPRETERENLGRPGGRENSGE
jgi:hypothetical protein